MSKSAIKSPRKTIGITMGDPRGIGPEVVRKALLRPEICRLANYVCIGDGAQIKGLRAAAVPIAYTDPGEGALRFLERGVDLIKGGVVDALVTAPLSKAAVNAFAPGFKGHTEYLAQAFGTKRFDMMFVAGGMRLSLVTRHEALKDVPALITRPSVFSSITLMHETLQRQFKLRKPRIAVLGLNPHAGEEGLLGKEEIRSIIPAIRAAAEQGIRVEGPFPADTFFIHDKGFDGVVAMYHDQGLAPIKGMYFKDLVNLTAGLPFVRTSPVHGTAYDIAGRGIADPSSMIAAIKLACVLS